MQLTTSRLGKWKVLTPKVDRLDAPIAEDFKAMLLSAIADGTKSLILELQDVHFMDSAGLGALVYTRQRMGSGATLSLVGAQPEVATLLHLTHLDRVFLVGDDAQTILDRDLNPNEVTA